MTAVCTPPVFAENVGVSVGVGDTVLALKGRAAPGALVTIQDGGSTIGATTATLNGGFEIDFLAFEPGIHQLGIISQTPQGPSTDLVIKEVNVTEHAVTNAQVFLPPTISIDRSIEKDAPLQLRGFTIPNALVIITLDDIRQLQTTSNDAGEWRYTLATHDLSPGEHTLYAISSDLITGGQSYGTNKRNFAVSHVPLMTLPPFLTPTSSRSVRPSSPSISYPTTGMTITQSTTAVRGTAQPGLRIDIYNDDRLIGSGFANTSGDWAVVITLTEQSYRLHARACRQNVCSTPSSTIRFFYEIPKELKMLSLRLTHYYFQGREGDAITQHIVIANGVPPYQVDINWGDKSKATFRNAGLTLALSHMYKKAASFGGSVKITDSEGHSAEANFAVEVLAKARPMYRGVALALVLVAAVLFATVVTYPYVSRRGKG